jgi:hypothetical protein
MPFIETKVPVTASTSPIALGSALIFSTSAEKPPREEQPSGR